MGSAILCTPDAWPSHRPNGPPGAAWRKLAKQFGKKWVHLPLSGFSGSTVQQLRMVHVLNGREIRSYASHFIRRP